MISSDFNRKVVKQMNWKTIMVTLLATAALGLAWVGSHPAKPERVAVFGRTLLPCPPVCANYAGTTVIVPRRDWVNY